MLGIRQGFIGQLQDRVHLEHEQGGIDYDYNSFGHRSEEAGKITSDPRGYMLVTGCSITEGIGLDVAETWWRQLADELDLAVYNLAVGGTGLDVIDHNLARWFLEFPKPKYLIEIRVDDLIRMVKPAELGIECLGSWSLDSKDHDLLMALDDQGVFDLRERLHMGLCEQLLAQGVGYYRQQVIWHPDRARDLAHPGPACNREMMLRALQHVGGL